MRNTPAFQRGYKAAQSEYRKSIRMGYGPSKLINYLINHRSHRIWYYEGPNFVGKPYPDTETIEYLKMIKKGTKTWDGDVKYFFLKKYRMYDCGAPAKYSSHNIGYLPF